MDMLVYQMNGSAPKGFVEKDLSSIAKGIFSFLKRRSKKKYLVSIQWVSEPEIERLNRVYRNKRASTDVLSFSPEDHLQGEVFIDSLKKEDEIDLGDLFICGAFARREARRRSVDIREELVRLIAHGTLHLMGYDHADEKTEERMFSMQEQVVESVLRN